ncbi:YebC/PmpR family DNA-binding transcriptional regulator [bacterium TMED181]|nr:YebC/PmpR family DNA-binding transcriptional regulator [Planctomycetota bacterium]OUW43533.1 MAG: YebC/PmpR family DNA-binding transcriptional regulator [bacterium TMED181]
MAGHSKWAGIKHKKAANDAKRGKIFSKLAKLITVAARDGGGDVHGNPHLKLVVDKAKAANMPNDNIDRAIKKGTGELASAALSELVYEGYSPGQVALMIDILTDNKNRTASELRKVFDKKGGQLGSPGSVSWMFETRGVIELPTGSVTEDDLLELALEAGADDVKVEEGHLQVLTSPTQFSEVREALAAANLEPSYAEVTRIPTSTVTIEDEKTATKVLNFIAEVEDNDDVQNVHTNMDISPEMLDKLSS